jgi:pyrophosphatase PpaX
MTLKAVFFDLDGTLLNSIPAIMDCFTETLDTMGISYDEDDLRHSIGIPLKVQADHYTGTRAQEFIDLYRKLYTKRSDQSAGLYSGALETLQEIRSNNYKIGLVTSKNARGTNRAMKLCGLDGIFDLVITADDVEHFKPHPEPIFKAMREMGVTSEESAYVGDSSFDIEMARRAGVEAIAVSWGARTHDELLPLHPDAIVDTWEELLDTLAREKFLK